MMYVPHVVNHTASLTFGHDITQFKQLVAFMTAISIVLWACVLVTFLMRVWLCHVWYRHLRRKERARSLPT